MINKRVGVAVNAFSQNQTLVSELKTHFKICDFNETGKRLEGTDLIEFLKPCECAIISLEKLNAEILKHLPNLKVIGKYGVGLDNINFQLLEKNNIKLLYTSGVNRYEVAEMTLGFVISCLRNIHYNSNLNKSFIWNKDGGISIQESIIGIIGLGNIGSEIARLLMLLGAKKILYFDIERKQNLENKILQYSTIEDLLSRADVITIHIPGEKNENYLNNDLISKIKKGSSIINTSRGCILDYDSIFKALEDDKLSNLCLDVYPNEPFFEEIIKNPKILCTPHISGNSNQAKLKMGRSVIKNLLSHYEN